MGIKIEAWGTKIEAWWHQNRGSEAFQSGSGMHNAVAETMGEVCKGTKAHSEHGTLDAVAKATGEQVQRNSEAAIKDEEYQNANPKMLGAQNARRYSEYCRRSVSRIPNMWCRK